MRTLRRCCFAALGRAFPDILVLSPFLVEVVQFSDWGKRRVMQLHKEGLSVSKIARCMDRSRRSIDLCLVKAKLREAPPYLALRQ